MSVIDLSLLLLLSTFFPLLLMPSTNTVKPIQENRRLQLGDKDQIEASVLVKFIRGSRRLQAGDEPSFTPNRMAAIHRRVLKLTKSDQRKPKKLTIAEIRDLEAGYARTFIDRSLWQMFLQGNWLAILDFLADRFSYISHGSELTWRRAVAYERLWHLVMAMYEFRSFKQ